MSLRHRQMANRGRIRQKNGCKTVGHYKIESFEKLAAGMAESFGHRQRFSTLCYGFSKRVTWTHVAKLSFVNDRHIVSEIHGQVAAHVL